MQKLTAGQSIENKSHGMLRTKETTMLNPSERFRDDGGRETERF